MRKYKRVARAARIYAERFVTSSDEVLMTSWVRTTVNNLFLCIEFSGTRTCPVVAYFGDIVKCKQNGKITNAHVYF